MPRLSSRVRIPKLSNARARALARIPHVTSACGLVLLQLVFLATLWTARLFTLANTASPFGPNSPAPNYAPPQLQYYYDSNVSFSWDFNEPLYSLNAANKSRVKDKPLTWEAIDFGTNVKTMATIYEGALNPPVWNRTNWAHVIFYHVFIPDSEATPVALNIIQEQVGQIAYAAPSNVVTPVYYSLVGPTSAQYRTKVEKFFARYPSLSLHLLQNIKAGNEEVTLNYLRDYCVQQPLAQRNTTWVTYLHNKGSFHPLEANHRWRRALTAGALHPHCLQPQNPSTNACGLQFFALFTFFFPGNMWTARSDFLSQLQPLAEHAPQTVKVLEIGMLMKLRRQVFMDHFPGATTDWFGVDRYTNEHWIGTHPDLVPADLEPTCDLNRLQLTDTFRYTELAVSLRGLRCRDIVTGPKSHFDVFAFLSEHTGERLRDYFFFPEMIIRWFTFYGRGPPDSSPIWTWLSDGNVWNKAVREHGISAVSVVTSPFALAETGRTSWTAFSNRTTNGSATLPKDITKVSKKQRIIFFHIVLPLSVGPLYQTAIAALSNQLQLVAESFQALSQKNSSLYYSLATRDGTVVLGAHDAVQITCKSHALRCIPLGDAVVSKDFAGETLWYVHQYCSVIPTSSIAYLSNVIPNNAGSSTAAEREQLILDTTRAALSKECWRSSGTTCSTCGLTFSTVGMLHYKGNMFTARCDYINKLMSPVQFELKMNELAGMAMAAHARGKIALGAYDQTPYFFGIDHYATEHWMGSHPSIIPCEVWGAGNATHLSFTDVGIQYQGLDVSMPNHERLRWYSLLPGNLMKWDYLYDAIPANDSWIWQEYPDGEYWKNSSQSQRLRLSAL